MDAQNFAWVREPVTWGMIPGWSEHPSIVANLGGSDPFWYLTLSFGGWCPKESSLVGAEGYDRTSESGSEISSSIGFSFGGTGSGVGSTEVGSLRDSSLLDSSG